MKIIAFTGMPFSGKSEAVTIAQQTGIPVVRMGDLVWDETKQRGLPLTDEHVGRVATEMRNIHGKDIWAKKTTEKIHTLQNQDIVIIDGIRNKEEIIYFKQKLGTDFVLIAITVPTDLRRKRGRMRGRTDDSTKLQDIKKRDQRELSWGLGEVINTADITINNAGTLSEFQLQVKQILHALTESIH